MLPPTLRLSARMSMICGVASLASPLSSRSVPRKRVRLLKFPISHPFSFSSRLIDIQVNKVSHFCSDYADKNSVKFHNAQHLHTHLSSTWDAKLFRAGYWRCTYASESHEREREKKKGKTGMPSANAPGIRPCVYKGDDSGHPENTQIFLAFLAFYSYTCRRILPRKKASITLPLLRTAAIINQRRCLWLATISA